MPRFHPVHALPLLLATTFTIGGAMPLWNPSGAIREFGLPEQIQTSTEAQSAWKIYGMRMSLWGVAMWTFFLRGNFEALDTMMSLFVGMGAVDGYVCYCEGVPGQGVFRFGTSILLGLWGIFGVNSRFAERNRVSCERFKPINNDTKRQARAEEAEQSQLPNAVCRRTS